MKKIAFLTAVAGVTGVASAQMAITEWMYNPNGEFVEFTNIGNTPIDMTGWSYDDDSQIASPSSPTGSSTEALDLSPFGVVQPGESVIITEFLEADFRLNWSLPASIKVIGEYTNNLGRGDQINLFDNNGILVDSLTYGDQVFPGSIRTQGRSGVPTNLGALGADDVFQWEFADTISGGGIFDLTSIYGGQGFRTSITGDTGNPGYFFIPTPSSAALLALGGLIAARRRRA